MPRTSTATRRREIVAGLRVVLAERGYAEASIKSIAAAAGLTAGLVHYHFGSKHEVLLALVDELIEAAWARVTARTVEACTPRERLAALVDGLLGVGPDTEPTTIRAWSFLGAEALKSEEVASAYQAFLAEMTTHFRRALGEALDAENRSQRELGAMSIGLVATVEGFIRVSTAAPGVVPAGSASRTLQRMAFGLVDAQPEVPRA